MNGTRADIPRQTDDMSRFSITVAEALVEFKRQGLSTSDRSIQRYCANGKLHCAKIDPDTRQPTNDDSNFVYLIDPASISERISQIREREDFSGTPLVATRPDMSGHDGSGRDMPRADASRRDGDEGSDHLINEAEKAEGKIEDLVEELQSLKIDKSVRDGIITQLKDDRAALLGQLGDFADRLSSANREIGKLETQLLALTGSTDIYPRRENPEIEDDEPADLQSPSNTYEQESSNDHKL